VRILDRYLLREFVYLALGLLGFIVIFIVVDLSRDGRVPRPPPRGCWWRNISSISPPTWS
jgi:hypothetical protein